MVSNLCQLRELPSGGNRWKLGGGKSENCHHDIPHNQAVFRGLVEEVEVK